MSKSKYGNSNLYMTTSEFADLIVNALHEQSYFNRDESAHPGDIAFAFSTMAETIGSTMSWAISQEHDSNKKNAVMQTGNLSKENLSEDSLGYSEWRNKRAYL
jgi:hypothetical protein